MQLTAKFHHPTFNDSEVMLNHVNKQTNRQTDKLPNKQMLLKTSTSLRYATLVGKSTERRMSANKHSTIYMKVLSTNIYMI